MKRLLILIFSVALCAVFLFYLNKNAAIRLAAEKMLPAGETVKKIEEIDKGCSNNLWIVATENNEFVLRIPKVKEDPDRFVEILDVSKESSACGLSPKIISESIEDQHVLIEYIKEGMWPSYEENFEPYAQTMHLLRTFHDKMRERCSWKEDTLYAPFDLIFNEGQTLENMPGTPAHYSRALKKTRAIFEKLKTHIKEKATLCHGDFHPGNVLLNTQDALKPLLIDFDSAAVGDPFFDIVKFSLSLPKEKRIKLLCEYLDKPRPTEEELACFNMMDLSLLMVVATVRLKSTITDNADLEHLLSKTEIEHLLDAQAPLPTFQSIPFEDASLRARQLGAIYALSEFLQRAEEIDTDSG